MDDQIDMDQGYTGVNQNVFILMNWFDSETWDPALPASKNGDKMGELLDKDEELARFEQTLQQSKGLRSLF